MSSVPMPRDLSEEGLRVWVRDLAECDLPPDDCFSCRRTARAVRALVEREVAKERASTREKVREAVEMDRSFSRATEGLRKGSYFVEYHKSPDEIVSRVLGEEAPRG